MKFRVIAETVMNFLPGTMDENRHRIPTIYGSAWKDFGDALRLRVLWSKCLKGKWLLSIQSENLPIL